MPKVSDPYAELAVKNAKYVKACTELYLANKGIEEIDGFDRFVNLEVLWLNNNKVLSLLYRSNSAVADFDATICSLSESTT